MDILFHAKRVDTKEWVEGTTLIKTVVAGNNAAYIAPLGFPFEAMADDKGNFGSIDGLFVRVDPDTVGQYTNEQDKNQRKIFVGNIIRENPVGAIGVIRFGEYSNTTQNECHIGFYIEWDEKHSIYYRQDLGFWAKNREIEIICDIHDNFDLF